MQRLVLKLDQTLQTSKDGFLEIVIVSQNLAMLWSWAFHMEASWLKKLSYEVIFQFWWQMFRWNTHQSPDLTGNFFYCHLWWKWHFSFGWCKSQPEARSRTWDTSRGVPSDQERHTLERFSYQGTDFIFLWKFDSLQ